MATVTLENDYSSIITSINQARKENLPVKARQLCETVIQQFGAEPSPVDAIYASLLLDAKEYETAVEILRRGLPDAAFDLACCYYSLDEPEEAMKYYLMADTYQGYLNTAFLHLKKNEPGKALPLFEKGAELGEKNKEPGLPSCYYEWAFTLHKMNQLQDAQRLYERSLELGPLNQWTYDNLAVLHMNNQRFEEAKQLLLEGIRVYPEVPTAYFNMACVYGLQGMVEETMEWVIKAVENGYSSPENIKNLKSDKDIACVRELPQFLELITDLENEDFTSCMSLDAEKLTDRPYRFREVVTYYYYKLIEEGILTPAIGQAINLNTIRINKFLGLNHLCKEIGQLKKLNKLHIADNPLEELPEEIYSLKNLKHVHLELKNQPEFPAFLSKLEVSQVFCLGLSNLKIKHIPDAIAGLHRLTELEIWNSQIETCSDELGSLFNLQMLSFSKTALKVLPSSCKYLSNLRGLSLQDNPELTLLPPEIALLPHLVWGDLVKFKRNGFPSTEAEQLFKEADPDKTPEQLAIHLALLQQYEPYLKEHADIRNILPALNSKVGLLRTNAFLWLADKLSSGYKENPLTATAVVWMTGKFIADNPVIKAAINAAGAKIVTKLTAATTHILIGEKHKDHFYESLTSGIQLFTESMLLYRQAEHESVIATEYNAEQLRLLLLSIEPSNMELALEMMTDYGCANDWMDELFIAFQFTDHQEHKSQIRQFIKQYGSAAIQSAISVKYQLHTAGDKKINEYLETWSEKTGMNVQRLAYAIFCFTRYRNTIGAMNFILTKGESWMKHQLIESMITANGELNFSGSLTDISGTYDTSEPGDSRYLITTLPEELAAFQQIKTLNLTGTKIKELPEAVLQLKALEILNISQCKISQLPPGLSQLTNLRQLLASNCAFKKFPEVICSLPLLEVLCLDARYQNIQSSFTIPDSLSNLQSLRMLDLSGNQLTSFPEAITELKCLELLNLRESALTSLPATLSQLINLKVLVASSNQLHLSYHEETANRFENFPEVILKMTNLERLHITGDQGIPDEIQQLPKLKILAVSPGTKEQLEMLREKLPQVDVHAFDYYPKSIYLS